MRAFAVIFRLLLALSCASQARAQVPVGISAGWNLLGNGSDAQIAVAPAFGESSAVTTVWKWNRAASRWMFYTARLDGPGLAAFAQAHGFDVLTSIEPKEGFWVHAETAATLSVPDGAPANLFASDLQQGWNLVGSADGKTPSELNQGIAQSLAGAGRAMTSAWAWDAATGKWRFFAPQLETQGANALADYIAGRGYLAFTGPLTAREGLWLDIGAAPGPQLAPGIAGTLELVAHDPVNLPRIDGLAFDRFGNLFGVLEVVNSGGGAVYIDKATGAVTPIALGIPGACQLDVHPNGDLYVSSELPIRMVGGLPFQFGGVYRVAVSYDASNRPVSGIATRLPAVLDSPEGVQALHADGDYGSAGQMFVAEDKAGGRIVRVQPDGSGLTELVGASANLQKPEGLAFGDFNGAQPPALYGAEKAGGRVFRVGADGSVTTFGNPAAIGGLNGPDNLEFGPDGYLYVGEKYGGRIVRIAANGTHTVVATGFDNIEGVAFDPQTGSLYVTEIELSRVWRVRF